MAFLIYNRTPVLGGYRYQRQAPIKLAGSNGVIARYVGGLTSKQQEGGWKIPGPDLARLAGVPTGTANPVVLMDLGSSEPQAVCLYELLNICGSSRDTTTHLVLEFLVLIDEAVGGAPEQYRLDFTVPLSRPRRVLNETLLLSGGTGGGTWRWGAPMMNIGATLVAPITPVPQGGAIPNPL